LFRQSGLMREKWERQDYRNGTLEKALSLVTETYTPKAKTEKKMATGFWNDVYTPARLVEEYAAYVENLSHIRLLTGIKPIDSLIRGSAAARSNHRCSRGFLQNGFRAKRY